MSIGKIFGLGFIAAATLLSSQFSVQAQSTLDLLFERQAALPADVIVPDAPVRKRNKKRIRNVEEASYRASRRPVIVREPSMPDAEPEAALDGGLEKASGGPRPDIEPRAPKTVAFNSSERPGTIVINSAGRELFYVLGNGRAYRYRIAVGKEGFSWAGTERVSNVTQWPDWYPPDEMRERKPELPKMMTGGQNNPLGARAIYLGNTLYRIHGTNDPRSIGSASSSGCFRMLNKDVVHLASIVNIGSKVVVVNRLKKAATPVAAKKSKARVRVARAERRIRAEPVAPVADADVGSTLFIDLPPLSRE
jgi:lipoprotein-anchoring transpeptidase ErfK/SrfK